MIAEMVISMLLQRINNADAEDLHLLLPPQINFPVDQAL